MKNLEKSMLELFRDLKLIKIIIAYHSLYLTDLTNNLIQSLERDILITNTVIILA